MAAVGEIYGFSRDTGGNLLVRLEDSVTGDPVEVSATLSYGAFTFDNGLASEHTFLVIGGTTPVFLTLGQSPTHITPTDPIEIAITEDYTLEVIELEPLVFSGVVIKFDAAPIRTPSIGVLPAEDVVFCPCDYRCDFEEKVFADDSDDGIKNDFTDFLFKKVAASDTIKIELVKEGVILAEIVNDALGAYYDGFDSQPLYVGWQADWTAIFNAYSGGRYQVRVTSNILGEEEVFLSRYFRLNTFDIISANNTVKIESFQTGRLENSAFDFTDLIAGGWRSSIRLFGTFGNMQPTIDRDIYQDGSYREVQNRDTVQREYKLNALKVPETLYDRLTTRDFLGNQILITSYDVLQEITYEKYPVVVDNYDEVRYDKLGRSFFTVTMTDRQKNIIKTNVQ